MSESLRDFSGRVLVVDDDSLVRMLVCETLQQAGFQVEEVDSGAAAVAAFQVAAPDLVLLDVLMPGLDGFRTCQELRALPRGGEVPVVLMTGLDDLDSITRAYQAGADDFLTKPLQFQLLPYRIQHNIRASRTLLARKQAEEQHCQLQAQLLQSQRMESLGSLAGGVAHDMNNVLGAILMIASANVEALDPDAPAYQAFDTIAKAAVRGGQMVKSLLRLARQNPAEERVLDMNAILLEEARLLERTTLSKVQLELDLAPDLHAMRGDLSALTHAFMNLCVNAVDAMPERGTLTVRTRNLDPGWIEVLVADTGTGMTREILDKALEPFFTTKEVGKGTGLGLSMVYSTVKAHRGRLELQSEPGRGTRVRMRFPACAAGTRAAVPGPEPPLAPSSRALTVLLVDDDELIQSSMRSTLEFLGHSAATASDGESALAMLEAGLEPDVVILDMNMPGLGGCGTLPRLRALCPGLPVLLATGRADQTAQNLTVAYPKVSLMSKPFTLRELQRGLEGLLAGAGCGWQRQGSGAA